MNASRFPLAGPRLLAVFGTAVLLAGISLAASRPVHSAGGPIAVDVANAPLPITTADDHDKQGVQYEVFIPVSAGGGSSNFSYTVPAGKRLVIESVSASPNNFADNDHYSILCFTQGGLGNRSGSSYFTVVPDGSPFPAGSVHPHQYADAGSAVSIEVYRTESSGGTTSLNVSVTGYLVDVP
jgi:hypothetical protein